MEQHIVECPNCHETLKKQPLRKSNCPSCKNTIYVLTVPRKGDVLLNSADFSRLDAFRTVARGWRDGIEQMIGGKEALDAERQLHPNDPDKNYEYESRMSLLRKWAVQHNAEGRFGYLTSDYLGMAELLRGVWEFQPSLENYLKVIFLDLNGPDNSGAFRLRDGYVTPYVIDNVKAICRHLRINADQLSKIFTSANASLIGSLPVKMAPEKAWVKVQKKFENLDADPDEDE